MPSLYDDAFDKLPKEVRTQISVEATAFAQTQKHGAKAFEDERNRLVTVYLKLNTTLLPSGPTVTASDGAIVNMAPVKELIMVTLLLTSDPSKWVMVVSLNPRSASPL